MKELCNIDFLCGEGCCDICHPDPDVQFAPLPLFSRPPGTYVEFDATAAVAAMPECPDCAGVGFPHYSNGFFDLCDRCKGSGTL